MPASEATPRICARRDVVGAVLLFTLQFTVRAGNIEVEIKESGGTPVADAVVWATPLSGGTSALKGKAIVAQKDKQFVPYVTAIQKGTAVQFPNQDDVKHHIYSFSPAKKFELPLALACSAALDRRNCVVSPREPIKSKYGSRASKARRPAPRNEWRWAPTVLRAR